LYTTACARYKARLGEHRPSTVAYSEHFTDMLSQMCNKGGRAAGARGGS